MLFHSSLASYISQRQILMWEDKIQVIVFIREKFQPSQGVFKQLFHTSLESLGG